MAVLGDIGSIERFFRASIIYSGFSETENNTVILQTELMPLRCKVITAYPNVKGRCALRVPPIFTKYKNTVITLVSLSALRHFDSSVRDKPYKIN